MDQAGFSFDAALDHIPASQLPPTSPHQRIHTVSENENFVEKLSAVLPDLPDDIDLDDLLLAVGLQKHSLIDWHRSRALDALLGSSIYQAYDANPDPDNRRLIRQMRFRRLPPFDLCPGFEGETCNVPTRGGVRCDKHLDMEEESLWNQE